jgi:rod shape-determining protein MreD
MNSKWILVALGLIVVFIQYVTYPFLNINRVVPDLVLIFVLLLSIKFESGFVFLMAFILGIFQDLILTNFIGLSSIGNLVAVYPVILFGSKSKSLETSTFLWKISMSSIIKYIIVFYVIFLPQNFGVIHILIYYVLPYMFYTLVLSFVLLLLFKNLLDQYVSS